jgi:hypothetical protein
MDGTMLALGRVAAGRRTRPPAQGVARILIVVAGRVFPAAFPAADRHVRPPDTVATADYVWVLNTP